MARVRLSHITNSCLAPYNFYAHYDAHVLRYKILAHLNNGDGKIHNKY